MAQQKAGHCINLPRRSCNSDNSGIHFLVTGDNSSGSIAVLELIVAGGARLMAPPTATSDENPGASMRLIVQHGSDL